MLTQEEDAAVEEIREIFEMNSEEIGPYLKGFFGRYDILDVIWKLLKFLLRIFRFDLPLGDAFTLQQIEGNDYGNHVKLPI